MVIVKYQTIMFSESLFHCCNFSQYLKNLHKSVSIRKSNLKCCTVTFIWNTHQKPKYQIFVAESLMISKIWFRSFWITFFFRVKPLCLKPIYMISVQYWLINLSIFNQCSTSIPLENLPFSGLFRGYRSGILI